MLTQARDSVPGDGGESSPVLGLHRAVMETLQRLLRAVGQGCAEGLGSNVPDRSCVNALQPSLPLTHCG